MITHLESEALLLGASDDLSPDLRPLADLLTATRETTASGPATPGVELLALFAGAPLAREHAVVTPASWLAARLEGLSAGLKVALACAAVVATFVVVHRYVVQADVRGELQRPAATATDAPTPPPPDPTSGTTPMRRRTSTTDDAPARPGTQDPDPQDTGPVVTGGPGAADPSTPSTDDQGGDPPQSEDQGGDDQGPVQPSEPGQPVTQGPQTEGPETDEPYSDAPETDEPDTDEPDTDEPETDEPDTETGGSGSSGPSGSSSPSSGPSDDSNENNG